MKPADELEMMKKSAESVKSVMRANQVID